MLSEYSGITTVARNAHFLIQISSMSQLARYQSFNYKFLFLLYMLIRCMLVGLGLHELNIMFLYLTVTVYSFKLCFFLFKTHSNILLQSLASLPSGMCNLQIQRHE